MILTPTMRNSIESSARTMPASSYEKALKPHRLAESYHNNTCP